MKRRASQGDRPALSKAQRELLLGVGGFVGFLVLSALLLVAFNPALRTSLASSLLAPKAQAPIELVVAHTNDTWGYTQPCG